LDEHVAKAVSDGLRRRGVDVLTVFEAHMVGASDEAQLQFATDHDRAIFTQDTDFLRLAARGLEHAGIVYARRRSPIGEILSGLILIHLAMTPDEMRNRVEYL
jgi:predicted nuclease of predicted toxin-antitoxin system